jgi:hypothetical protein
MQLYHIPTSVCRIERLRIVIVYNSKLYGNLLHYALRYL